MTPPFRFVAWKQRISWSKGHVPMTDRPTHGLIIWRAACGVELPLRAVVYKGPDRCRRCITELSRLKETA
jgi:hypothetical protein